MTESRLSSPIARVRQINAELAEWVRCDPAPLHTGAGVRQQDDLVFCGLLGGKDVGKSTLINALAGEDVSVDHVEVGEGTVRPVAYVHVDATDALQRRFTAVGASRASLDYDVKEHRVDAIRSLVLVDLPDIDSTYGEHLRTVQRAVDVMDRVVWVFDPKKGDDRAVGRLLPRIVRDHNNVYAVLNRLDETLTDGFGPEGPERFLQLRAAWFDECLESLGLNGDKTPRFMFSARFPRTDDFVRAVARCWGDPEWSRFGDDESRVRAVAEQASAEFERFRSRILCSLSAEEVTRIKRDNSAVELETAIDAVLRHYDLEGVAGQCDEIVARLEGEYVREFADEYASVVSRRLARSGRGEAELAQSLLSRRVERWPVLRVVHWPLRGLVRWLGTRFSSARSGPASLGPDDLLRVHGRGLEHRVDTLQSRVRRCVDSLPDGLASAVVWPGSAAQSRNATGALVEGFEQLDDDVLARCRAGDSPPGVVGRVAIWSILFWFPLVQPLAKGALVLAAERSLTGGVEAALTLVIALGAVSLLKGLAASGLVYLVILATMFGRAVRDVRRERGECDAEQDVPSVYIESVDAILGQEILEPLRGPVQDAMARLVAYRDELTALRGRPSQEERNS